MAELESILADFESHWRSLPSPPDIEAFLAQAPEASRRSVLVELVGIDLDYQWLRKPESKTVEDYLQQFPELAADPASLLNLLAEEYRCRHRANLTPQSEEFVSRFPQLEQELKEVLSAVHEQIEASLKTLNPKQAAAQSTYRLSRAVNDTSVPQGNRSKQSSRGLPQDPQGIYRLDKELARGGMGAVYVGYDLKLDREVAIKTLLPHADAGRFETESKITAKLPHPGIPPVYALGELSDGSPFLAMKLVKGATLQEALAGRKDTKHHQARFVQIFEQVAHAVGFAHAQGIIHRDLKPANVMVGAFGEIQVMDWGLAKELSRNESSLRTTADSPEQLASCSPMETFACHTQVGDIMGTPSYMPPEQASGKPVDARADVFSLGCILTLMLTGELVFDGKNAWEVVKAAAAGDTKAALSRLSNCGAEPQLVDIAVKCLAVDPEERPANGEAVATLISNYRQSVETRLRQAEAERAAAEAKAIEQQKRRRVILVAAGVIAAVLLVGVMGTSWGLIRVEQARGEEAKQRKIAVAAQKAEALRANSERDAKDEAKAANELTQLRLTEIEKINSTIFDIFAELDVRKVEAEGGDPLEYVLAERLSEAGRQLNADAIHDPLVLAKLKERLGVTLIGLGQVKDAIPFLQDALTIRLDELGPKHLETLSSQVSLAGCYREAGREKEAIALYEDSWSLAKELLGDKHAETLACMNGVATAYCAVGRDREAVDLWEQALTGAKETLGPDHLTTLKIMNNLATGYLNLGEFESSVSLHEQANELLEEKLGPYHPTVLAGFKALGYVHYTIGKPDAAIPYYQKAIDRRKEKLGADHPFTLELMNNIAAAYSAAGKHELAMPIYEELVETWRAKNGPYDARTLLAMNNLAAGYAYNGERLKAIPLHEQTLKLRQEHLGPDHPDTFASMTNLANCYVETGDQERAIAMHEDLLKRRQAVLGLDHVDTLISLHDLAYCYSKNDLRAAVPLYEQALDLRKQKLGTDHPQTLLTAHNLALCYSNLGKPDSAIALHELILTAKQKTLGTSHPDTLAAMSSLARACYYNGDAEKAQETTRQLAERKEAKFGLGNEVTLDSLDYLVRYGAPAKAENKLRLAVQNLQEDSPDVWQTCYAQVILGAALNAQQKYDEAEPLLVAGYQGMAKHEEELPSKALQRLKDTNIELVRLYAALEKPEEVAKWETVQQRRIATQVQSRLRQELESRGDQQLLAKLTEAAALLATDESKAIESYRVLAEDVREEAPELLPAVVAIFGLIGGAPEAPIPDDVPWQAVTNLDWSQACKDYTKYIAEHPDVQFAYTLAGGSFLLAGQEQEYQEFRKRAIRRFAKSLNQDVLHSTASIYFLHEISDDDAADAELAAKAARLAYESAKESQSLYMAYYELSYGISELRLGRPQNTLEIINSSAQVEGPLGVGAGSALVLAHKKIGDSEAAQRRFKIVSDAHAKLVPMGDYQLWQTAEILYQEAKAAME